ncbi:hypothetical protein DPEC_G00270460 [Dallia pectoralis]|uniref:Uncharacterized protein n=1 Tax=Dallia pectoralis TaxID=75939 RepID=A0ACC2FPE6_DALPE|nr:hypothetical protein DPEC_G00270460 [Dallia pectoralis]
MKNRPTGFPLAGCALKEHSILGRDNVQEEREARQSLWTDEDPVSEHGSPSYHGDSRSSISLVNNTPLQTRTAVSHAILQGLPPSESSRRFSATKAMCLSLPVLKEQSVPILSKT